MECQVHFAIRMEYAVLPELCEKIEVLVGSDVIFFEKGNFNTQAAKGGVFITNFSLLAQDESSSVLENCTWRISKRLEAGKKK